MDFPRVSTCAPAPAALPATAPVTAPLPPTKNLDDLITCLPDSVDRCWHSDTVTIPRCEIESSMGCSQQVIAYIKPLLVRENIETVTYSALTTSPRTGSAVANFLPLTMMF